MSRILRITLAVALIASFACATRAGDDDAWSIVRASGQVWVQAAGGAQAVSLGETRTIASGDTLATSATGRVLLQRGEETMIVGPNTVMSLAKGSSRLFTTVIEAAGEIEFDVQKRNVRHFAVKTPLLAAVVKGTHFVVRAGANGDAVVVERGHVEIEALRTGEKADLLPGQGAQVSEVGLVVFGSTGRADTGLGEVDAASVSQDPDADADSANPNVGGGNGNGNGVSVGVGGSNGIGVGIGGGNGIAAGVGGSNGVSASAGGGNGIAASVGGSNGVSASVGGGNGVAASAGGSSGVGVSIGGGNGVGVQVGGIGLGIGGH